MNVEKYGLLYPFFKMGRTKSTFFLPDGEKFWSNFLKTVSRFSEPWGREFAIGTEPLFWDNPSM